MAKKKFSFGGIKPTTPKKHINKRTINELIYKSPSYDPNKTHLIFISEVPITVKAKLRALCIWIARLTSLPFLIISATDMVVPLDTIAGDGVLEFYLNNHSKFADYINNNSLVFPMGSSTIAMTGDDNVYHTCFTDWMFGDTKFYIRKYNRYVYPIFGVDSIIIKDKQGTIRPRHWSRTNFSEYQIKKAIAEKIINCVEPRDPRIIKFTTREEVSTFLQSHMGVEELLSWDTETSGLDFRKDHIGCITMSFDGRTGYFIPWRLVDPEELNQFFIGKKGIGSNIKFDIRMARKYGITNAKAYCDTHNLGHIINENRKNGLKSLVYHYTQFGGYDADLNAFIRANKITNYLDIPEPLLYKYATMDAIVGFQIYEAMQKQLDNIDNKFVNPYYADWTLRRYFEEIVMPWVEESAEIELDGIYVDMVTLEENSLYFQNLVSNLKQEIAQMLNCSINVLGSAEQLGKLFESRGWKEYGRTKKGHYKTNDICLAAWVKDGHPEAKKLQRMRSLDTLYGTFVGSKQEGNGWYQYIFDGKINPDYQAMLADSGRNKCRNPNFQNLACHDSESKHITRNVGLPPGSFKFCTVDYSALQIRLCAIESQDPKLCDIYRNNRSGGDLHSITGYNIFCAEKNWPVQIMKVTGEDGNTIEFLGHKKIVVTREGQQIEITGWDIREGDEITESTPTY